MAFLQTKSNPKYSQPHVSKNKFSVLIIDDDLYAKDRLELVLQTSDELSQTSLLQAHHLSQGLDILSSNLVHAVLLDKTLEIEGKPPENGIEGIPSMLRLQPHLQILVLTGSRDIPDVVRAMKLGAFNYITKETPQELLVSHIDRAVHLASLKLEKEQRERAESDNSIQLGGKSQIFLSTLKQAESMAPSNRPVLILGETGTGKTELAQWIHHQRGYALKQKGSPFFPVNVSALSSQLIESELFGHEKGAFTDASRLRRGLFEVAQNGTLFLDEIGELPLALQSKLLTVIEKGTFMRVGGTQTLHSNAKLLFATNRNLEKMVKEGSFREDLLMRISLLTIRIPSLSERQEDIPDIIRAMLPRACHENRVARIEYEDLPTDFIELLKQSHLQGNIRGLQHQLERLLVFSPRDKSGNPVFTYWKEIPGLNLMARGRRSPNSAEGDRTPITYRELKSRPWNLIGDEFPGLNQMLEEIRIALLSEASEKFENRRQSAKALGFIESSFSMLLKRYPDIDQKYQRRGNQRRIKRSHEEDPPVTRSGEFDGIR